MIGIWDCAAGEVFEGKHHGSSVCIKVLGVNAERAIRRAVSAYRHTHSLCHSRLVSSYGACAKVLSHLSMLFLLPRYLEAQNKLLGGSPADPIWQAQNFDIQRPQEQLSVPWPHPKETLRKTIPNR